MKNKVVILQDNLEAIQEIKSAIDKSGEFTVVGVSTSGEEGLNLISKTNPNVLITGIILKGLDGFSVLEEISKNSLNVKSIVVSSFSREEIINKALELNAYYYIIKPFNKDILLKRLKDLVDNPIKETVPDNKKKVGLDERISKIFISVGIPPHIKGYVYLREGVKMAVSDPEVINNITKQLYPKIGEKYKTTASKVERAIRHAIEVAFNRGRIETINTLFGMRAYVNNEKPTNGEFIALIADKMILEGA